MTILNTSEHEIRHNMFVSNFLVRRQDTGTDYFPPSNYSKSNVSTFHLFLQTK